MESKKQLGYIVIGEKKTSVMLQRHENDNMLQCLSNDNSR